MPKYPNETFYEYQARMKREGLYNGGNGFKQKSNSITPSKTSAVAETYKKIWSLRKLPTSPVEEYFRSKVQERGFYNLENDSSVIGLPSEDHIYGLQKKGYHEKSWPDRVGIVKADGMVFPHYFRSFDTNEGYRTLSSKLITNAVFGRLYPTKMDYHIAKIGRFGTLGIDLNNITGVKSMRLDKYLYGKGISFDSIRNYLDGIKSGAFSDDLTQGAIIQLGLSGYTIPNAIGEQDPNTRNIILLGDDNKDAKFDSIVRIDFENSHTGTSQETDVDETRVYPFGVYGRDEYSEEFQENLARAITDKEISSAEAQFLLNLNTVTKYATRRTAIDNATVEAMSDCRFIGKDNISVYPSIGLFTPDKFEEITSDVAEMSENYTAEVVKVLSNADSVISTTFQDPTSFIPTLEQ